MFRMPSPTAALVLASTSRYRAGLLQRLGLPFETLGPEVDETPLPAEPCEALAQRLARAKALTVAARRPGCIVIGSDQVPALADRPLHKPGTRERAIAQLQAQSGREVVFLTALAVVDAGGRCHEAMDRTRVRFRTLTTAEIERYVDAEPALDCAGAFKCEGLGITLFEAIHTEDPSALVGLPLIALRRLLAAAGLALP